MRTRFFCPYCKAILDFDETVPDHENKQQRRCKKCGYEVANYNFSDDGQRYATRDPYIAALLCCMGAKIAEHDASDPENVIFILQHEDMVKLRKESRSPELATYDVTKQKMIEILQAYISQHKELMGLVRENRLNAKYHGRKK
jgi:glutaredoxin